MIYFALTLLFIDKSKTENIFHKHPQFIKGKLYKKFVTSTLQLNVWFQKISIPPPRRVTEIPRGRGV